MTDDTDGTLAEPVIGMLPSLNTLRAAIEFLQAADGLTGLHKIRVGGRMLTAGQVASEIKSSIEGTAVQSAADDEEEFCTCGAGHGSGEEHTDWCKWTALAPRLYPPILPPLLAVSQ